MTPRTDRGHLLRRTGPFRALTATATLSALLLTACGGDDDPTVEEPTSSDSEDNSDTEATETESTTEAPADSDDAEETAVPSGPVSAEDGSFEVTAPDGWIDVRDQVEQQVEIAVRDDELTDDFFTNIVVTTEDPIGDLEDSIEAAAEQVAGSDGEYEMLDPIQIADTDAYGFVLTRVTGGVEVAQTQWWLEHGEQVYVTTFSTAKTQQEASEPIMEEILSTWTWQD